MADERRAALVERMANQLDTKIAAGMVVSADIASAALDLALEEAEQECRAAQEHYAALREEHEPGSDDWVAFNASVFGAGNCLDRIRALKASP